MKQISIKDDQLRVWRRNWAARGTTIMNSVEIEPASQPIVQENHVPIIAQLQKLSRMFPNNGLYKSLLVQYKVHPFSKKQMDIIQRDYQKKVFTGKKKK
jgi:hypothetical protein